MLRRPFLPRRPPCISNLRRLATLYPYPQASPRQHPSTALSISIAENGLRPPGEKEARSPDDKRPPQRVKVIDPATNEPVTIDLNTVEPFTARYGLLPLPFRIIVERRHLFKTLRERQNTAYDVDSPEEDETRVIKPDPEVIKKYVLQFIRNRQMKMEEPPSKEKIQYFIRVATKKALSKEKNRLSLQAERPLDPALSFEEQWHRRQSYGTSIFDIHS
jgi:hypothetical protein